MSLLTLLAITDNEIICQTISQIAMTPFMIIVCIELSLEGSIESI